MGRVLQQLLQVPACRLAEGNGERNMTNADAHVFLRVGIEVEDDGAAGVGEDRAAEPADIAFLHHAVLDLTGGDTLELVDADGRVVLVQSVATNRRRPFAAGSLRFPAEPILSTGPA